MKKIYLLTDQVINKIAAGEVVERPASVVKELVENAMDAGATDIHIELQDGGRRLISVSDNGPGIAPDDVPLAVLRHATSKIKSIDDLATVASMGFRGEALASIASVAKFTLTTTTELAGTRLTCEGGETPLITPMASGTTAGRTGTVVTVENIFFNVPARLKFLKAPAAEYAACLELVHALILARPDIGLKLVHNGKEVVRALPSSDQEMTSEALRSRAAIVLGDEAASALVWSRRESPHVQISGLISPPGHEKSTARGIHLFVNGRWVRDRNLRYAVLRGYQTHLMAGKFPIAILHLTLDPALVDVNVHPAKTEVRLQYPAEVHGEITLAIRSTLRQGAWSAVAHEEVHENIQSQNPEPLHFTSSRSPTGFAGSSFLPKRDTQSQSLDFFSSREPRPIEPISRRVGVERLSDEFTTSNTPLEVRSVAPDWAELRYIGAFARCYLFFEGGDDLLAVDQHAFHERIVFERLMRDRQLLGRSQPLLVPESVDLGPQELQVMRERQAELSNAGFRLHFVGDTTLEVTAIPAVLAGRDLQAVIGQLARANETDALAHDLVATIACHTAVRAGEELGPDELKQLLREAAEVDFFHNCPHGRRVFRWYKRSQVAAWFDR